MITTSTTIVTFLMVFLIQNTQNRDAQAIQLHLDELLRGVSGARTGLVGLEQLSDEQLQQLQEEFERVRDKSNGTTEAPVVKKSIEQEHCHRSSTSTTRNSGAKKDQSHQAYSTLRCIRNRSRQTFAYCVTAPAVALHHKNRG